MLFIAPPENGPLVRSLILALFWDERKRPLATPESLKRPVVLSMTG
jgi:hypothetical protein